MYRQSLLIALLSLSTGPFTAAELQPTNAPKRAQCKFEDHTDVIVEYGSMGMNGRKIFGGLVPYGKTWQMGSEQSPTFVTSANVVIGGKDVPAGHYSLLTIPDPDKWTLVIKKISSPNGQNPLDDVARIDLTVRRLTSALESFTISFDQIKGGCVLNLRWEQTEASVLLAEKN